MNLVVLIKADPDRCELVVNDVERDASNALKLCFIDRLVKIRIDGGLGDTKRIFMTELCLWNALFDLFFRHAKLKAGQFGRRRQFANLFSALGRSRLDQEEEQNWEQECSWHA